MNDLIFIELTEEKGFEELDDIKKPTKYIFKSVPILFHINPWQIGKMNRFCDYRTELIKTEITIQGVTFFVHETIDTIKKKIHNAKFNQTMDKVLE